jgi:selenocysteine lyase/cysteine desulfurase
MYEHEFDLDPDLIYLNHAAVGPWPTRTKDAVIQFANLNSRYGARNYDQWLQTELQLREQLAKLIGAPSASDIALQKNTSEALSTVAYGLPWVSGDRVVISDQEFPSNRIVWESLKTLGVSTDRVDLDSAATPEQALMDAVQPSTRLIAVSSVQFASGLRMDLARLSEFCQTTGILLCVDAIQSLGAGDFNLKRTPVDFVVADGHKWMLAPEGTALLYVRAALRESLKLHEYGWHMVKRRWDFTQTDWEVAADGSRFECGSSNMTGVHALHASLSLIHEIGISHIESRLQTLLNDAIDWIDNQPQLRLITPRDPHRRLGILTLQRRDCDHAALYRAAKVAQIICAERCGGIRLSPHFYTRQDKLMQALEFIRDFK